MAASDAIAAEGGFADPVFNSQAIFSAIMTAFSRPGTIIDLGRRVQAPTPLAPAAAAILAALGDFDTPVWLDGKTNTADVGAWITFQTGAALTNDLSAAHFAVLSAPEDFTLDDFSIGTSEYPDRSATVIVVVDSLDGGPPLTLTGPGIETETAVHPCGSGQHFLAEWKRNNALFPRGIDVILVCGSEALALPRTTRIGSA